MESYNFSFMFIIWFFLHRLALCVCLNNLSSPNSVLSGNAACASKTLSQNPCHLCPPYLPICGIFLPLQVNLSCATFKLFKIVITPYLCLCLPAHEEVVDGLYYTCQSDFIQTSSLHLLIYNFAKRAGSGVPSPLNLQL